jgi:hypothetical protein
LDKKEKSMTEPTEFAKFDAVVRKVFAVPHDEIVKREKEYQRKRKRVKQKRAKRRTTDDKL